jgi:hypothetical protein
MVNGSRGCLAGAGLAGDGVADALTSIVPTHQHCGLRLQCCAWRVAQIGGRQAKKLISHKTTVKTKRIPFGFMIRPRHIFGVLTQSPN